MTEVESIKDPFRIVFPKLDIDVSINPTAFSIFGFDIQWSNSCNVLLLF